MRNSMRALVSGAVQSSQIAVVAGMLLAFALPIRPAAAQQLVDDSTLSASPAIAVRATLPSMANDGTLQDPPRRFPPTGGPRIPGPLLPPRRSKPYPTIPRDELNCAQTIALGTVAGAGIGAMTGVVTYFPIWLGWGDRLATRTFRIVAISGALIGFVGGASEPPCR